MHKPFFTSQPDKDRDTGLALGFEPWYGSFSPREKAGMRASSAKNPIAPASLKNSLCPLANHRKAHLVVRQIRTL